LIFFVSPEGVGACWLGVDTAATTADLDGGLPAGVPAPLDGPEKLVLSFNVIFRLSGGGC
jgi:hypothetical protein